MERAGGSAAVRPSPAAARQVPRPGDRRLHRRRNRSSCCSTFGTPRSGCKEAARNCSPVSAACRRSSTRLPRPGAATAGQGVGPKNIFALHFIQGVARATSASEWWARSTSAPPARWPTTSSTRCAAAARGAHRGLPRRGPRGPRRGRGGRGHGHGENTIYPRELVKAALARNASALVIAHNHPSGSLTPSRQDSELTRSLYLGSARSCTSTCSTT